MRRYPVGGLLKRLADAHPVRHPKRRIASAERAKAFSGILTLSEPAPSARTMLTPEERPAKSPDHGGH